MTLPNALRRPIDVLMIDNFDSFTWNLYQSLCLLGADVTVIRNDAIPSSALPQLNIKSLVISPGPGHPISDSGISRDAIKFFTGKVPVLGVCMGLECLVDVFGGEIGYAGEIMHGKVSPIRHDSRGVFRNLPQNFNSIRYHSLSASASSLPSSLCISAISADSGVIMGVRHRQFTLESVQYHPESCLSEEGDPLLKNFLNLRGGSWEQNPTSGVLDPNLPPFKIEVPVGASPAESADAKKVPSILEKIYAKRLQDVEVARRQPGTSFSDLTALIQSHLAPPLTSFVAALKAPHANGKVALMAEIKRASPSKGDIALGANAAEQATQYALAGASVISVLTEPTWFKGSLLDMRLARQAVDSLPNRPAILRKDFILDEYQIAEARLWGADTVLLIVAMLPLHRLKSLYAYAISLGMEPLVEVNNAKEMAAALDLGAKVIGVNNRNLHDFKVDMETTTRLVDQVKERNGDVVLAALSGIGGKEDVRRYREQGVGAVLVGESLMRAKDTGAFVRELLDLPEEEQQVDKPAKPLVKICGIRTEEEAVAAVDAGADMLGLMFVPSSKRYVSVETARQICIAARNAQLTQPMEEELSSVTPSSGSSVRTPWFTAHSRSLPPTRPLLVGVFQNQPLSHILYVASTVDLDLVQLHGSEPLELAKFIPVPVIRAFHVDEKGRGLEEVKRPGLHQFVLVDSMRSDGLSGGSGKVVDWELARKVVSEGESASASSRPTVNGVNGVSERTEKSLGFPMPIILAGGLTSANVKEAVELVKPWAVDVSGGVETEDGSGKDAEKVRAFVEAVKGE